MLVSGPQVIMNIDKVGSCLLIFGCFVYKLVGK